MSAPPGRLALGHLLILLALVVLLTRCSAQRAYCHLHSCAGQSHTMCTYRKGSMGKGCDRRSTPKSVGPKERIEILEAHNRIRSDVKAGKYAKQGLPAAAEMPDLQWDPELAAIAQRWADQCKEDHDQCRDVKRFQVGQNAAWTWGSPLDWTKGAIQGWFHEELPYFRQKDLVFRSGRDSGSGKQIGHLTQVIWADTKFVGCGYSASPEGSWVKRSYICNYGPAGNVLGQRMYRVAGSSDKEDARGQTNEQDTGRGEHQYDFRTFVFDDGSNDNTYTDEDRSDLPHPVGVNYTEVSVVNMDRSGMPSTKPDGAETPVERKGRFDIADYCRLISCAGQPHTMCTYRIGTKGKNCGKQTPKAVGPKERREILEAHNRIRRDVKAGKYAKQGLPAAAEMPDLQWDSELAAIAQRWADQCKEDHDQCRDVKRFQVGQNAAWTWGSPLDWTKGAIHGWFHEELPFFRQNDLVFRSVRDPSTGKPIGHLTQVIWADTRFVGCGYTEGREGSWMKRSYFCNYGPSGNVLGETIYHTTIKSPDQRTHRKERDHRYSKESGTNRRESANETDSEPRKRGRGSGGTKTETKISISTDGSSGQTRIHQESVAKGKVDVEMSTEASAGASGKTNVVRVGVNRSDDAFFKEFVDFPGTKWKEFMETDPPRGSRRRSRTSRWCRQLGSGRFERCRRSGRRVVCRSVRNCKPTENRPRHRRTTKDVEMRHEWAQTTNGHAQGWTQMWSESNVWRGMRRLSRLKERKEPKREEYRKGQVNDTLSNNDQKPYRRPRRKIA
ncbi:uncharacterized protein LOC122394402 [Amphibalanus amphitrite]|uniref:uncharacterized protein LOC122394402 n=1 Tax=Amphibalanus amphitrite TaxID=1232801 RepID=UPI001C9073DC|nr:uncharacterized protein LOC122394402 [Amphibalanus amphitrite]